MGMVLISLVHNNTSANDLKPWLDIDEEILLALYMTTLKSRHLWQVLTSPYWCSNKFWAAVSGGNEEFFCHLSPPVSLSSNQGRDSHGKRLVEIQWKQTRPVSQLLRTNTFNDKVFIPQNNNTKHGLKQEALPVMVFIWRRTVLNKRKEGK